MGKPSVAVAVLQRLRTASRQTPGQLRLIVVGLGVLALAFGASSFRQASALRGNIKAVGEDAAPSIIAAQKIKAWFADMHANLANELMVEPDTKNLELLKARDGENGAVNTFKKRREELVGLLDVKADKSVDGEGVLLAVHNVTYLEEAEPIRKILLHLAEYQELVGRARACYQAKDMVGARKAYQAADTVFHIEFVKAADALASANQKRLDSSYSAATAQFWWGFVESVLAGGALLAALVITQLFLYRRTHRILNPALLGATAVTVVFFVCFLATFWAASRDLRVADENALTSIVALTECQADAYDANGAESRWLLAHDDPSAAEREAAEYGRLRDLILKPPPGQTLKQVAASDKLPAGCSGYLEKELDGFMFPGEAREARDTLQQFVAYDEIDREIRDLADKRKLSEAKLLCVGKSNEKFAAFDAALRRTLAINTKQFSSAINRGQNRLAPFDYASPAAAVAIFALAFLGLRPRIREYDLS